MCLGIHHPRQYVVTQLRNDAVWVPALHKASSCIARVPFVANAVLWRWILTVGIPLFHVLTSESCAAALTSQHCKPLHYCNNASPQTIEQFCQMDYRQSIWLPRASCQHSLWHCAPPGAVKVLPGSSAHVCVLHVPGSKASKAARLAADAPAAVVHIRSRLAAKRGSPTG